MDKNNFERILFQTAFCCMACDGEIHDAEIQELKWVYKNTLYFKDLEFTNELNLLLINSENENIIENLFAIIEKENLSIVKELLLLEISLRIINSDKFVKEIEVQFVQYLRSKLKVPNEIIFERFGLIEFFSEKNYSEDLNSESIFRNLMSVLKTPEYEELLKFDFNKIE